MLAGELIKQPGGSLLRSRRRLATKPALPPGPVLLTVEYTEDKKKKKKKKRPKKEGGICFFGGIMAATDLKLTLAVSPR